MRLFSWRKQPKSAVGEWLFANKEKVRAGEAEWDGVVITDSTVFCRYECAFIGFDYVLADPQNRWRRVFFWISTLTTLIPAVLASILSRGWLLPIAIPVTLRVLWVNCRGGHQRTAGSLLQEMETGWKAPALSSASGHQKKLIEITPKAGEEIRARREAGSFSPDVGVRITPLQKQGDEVRVSFDYPVSDGGDWVDHSDGLLLLIDKSHEPDLLGRSIEFVNGTFIAKQSGPEPEATI